MVVVHHLGFLKVRILRPNRVEKFTLCHRDKFDGDRSNRRRDMAIFRFFKMAAVRHLGFIVRAFSLSTDNILVVLIMVKSLVGIDAAVSTI